MDAKSFIYQFDDVSLNPNDPAAHDRYSLHLIILRRLDEAMAELKHAQELDPRLTTSSWMNAWVYLLTADLGAAIEQAKTTIDFDPNNSTAQWLLGIAYLRQRRDTEAIAQLQKAFALSGSRIEQSFLGYGYAIAGKRTEALAILKELEKGEASGVKIAAVYSGLGDEDQAFAWLEKAFWTHSGDLIVLLTNLGLDSLRSDPATMTW